jgi:hypothetical protein
VIIAAHHLPGDLSIAYTSPWAGANWLSTATDNGVQENWDAVTYAKFGELAESTPEAGVMRMDIRALFDNAPEDAGVLSKGTGKIWYDSIVPGGIRWLDAGAEGKGLPEGVRFGFEIGTFVIDVSSYLPW